jgi:hypothetical protein
MQPKPDWFSFFHRSLVHAAGQFNIYLSGSFFEKASINYRRLRGDPIPVFPSDATLLEFPPSSSRQYANYYMSCRCVL